MEFLENNIQSDKAPPTEEVKNCPLCNNSESEFLFWNFDRMHRLPGKFGLVRCKNCELVRLSPRPTKEGLGFYYPEEGYYSYSMMPDYGNASSLSFKEKIRSSVMHSLGYPTKDVPGWMKSFSPLFKLIFLNQATYGSGEKFPKYVANGKALDIGSGSGLFLSILKRYGWQVQGVDISEDAAKRAKEFLDIDVFVGDVESADFEPESFDFISMNHSLEHLPNLNETLRTVKKLLKPAGVLYIEVPNVESLSCKISKQHWLHWDSPRHLFSFSPRTLKLLLNKNDFEIAELKSIRADFYYFDFKYKREEELKEKLNDRMEVTFADKLKIKSLGIFTDIYCKFNRLKGDYLSCWATKK